MACHDVGFRHRPGPTGHGRAEPAAQGHGTEDRETEEIDNQNAEGSKASDRRACQVKLISTNIEIEQILKNRIREDHFCNSSLLTFLLNIYQISCLAQSNHLILCMRSSIDTRNGII